MQLQTTWSLKRGSPGRDLHEHSWQLPAAVIMAESDDAIVRGTTFFFRAGTKREQYGAPCHCTWNTETRWWLRSMGTGIEISGEYTWGRTMFRKLCYTCSRISCNSVWNYSVNCCYAIVSEGGFWNLKTRKGTKRLIQMPRFNIFLLSTEVI